jgi:hypothetical protein
MGKSVIWKYMGGINENDKNMPCFKRNGIW